MRAPMFFFAQAHGFNEPVEPSLFALLVLGNEGLMYLCLDNLLVIQIVTEILDLRIEIEFGIIMWSTTIER